MNYKVLTKNGVNNTNIDGARMNNFAAGMRNGVIKGALNECELKTNASNSVYVDTGVLLIQGHPIVINEPIYQTFANQPTGDERYAFIAKITVNWTDDENADKRADVNCNISVQNADKELRQDDLFATATGAGVYEVEIGRFTVLTTGVITDLTRTLDAITGGSDASGDTYWQVGEITTNTLPAGSKAEFDMEYNEETGAYDITIGIPKGIAGTTIIVGSEIVKQVEFNSDPQMQIDNALQKATEAKDIAVSAEANTSDALAAASDAETAASAAQTVANEAKEMAQSVLSTIYQIGAIYLSITNISPASFIGGSWVQLDANYALWTATSDAGNTIPAGLPDMDSSVWANGGFLFKSNKNIKSDGSFNGAFKLGDVTYTSYVGNSNGESGYAVQGLGLQFSKANPNIYKSNVSTVQPPAYKVYAWRRTA